MIPGLRILDLKVHKDERGYFKENWRAGWIEGFHPVQSNVSLNIEAGTTRGLHAEPWDKLVSVATGRVFGAWMDLREGSTTFGHTFTCEITPDKAVFVPRGVANGFQALEDNTAYIYLVNDHWRADAQYVNASYTNIDWPLEPLHLSAKDQHNPVMPEPLKAKKIMVTGADGQLGQALRRELGERADYFSRQEFDITDPPELPWREYSTIINAAAYNHVDQAENEPEQAWRVNALAPATLARIANEHDLVLIHVSTDYVFDGSKAEYSEDDPVSPISAYGASKAAGEIAAQGARKHYVARTAWVVGEGNNFVRTMRTLAEKGVEPQVVNDETGRITMAEDLAKAIVHLLDTQADYGLYNVTCTGDPVSRDELAMATFIGVGHDPAEVHPVSSAEYHGDKPHARRPSRSVLSTAKLEATGFTPRNWRVGLALYLA